MVVWDVVINFGFHSCPQICDFTQSNTTTCKFGKISYRTTKRQVFNGVNNKHEKGSGVLVTETVKVIKLSFLEKTISKVKLL